MAEIPPGEPIQSPAEKARAYVRDKLAHLRNPALDSNPEIRDALNKTFAEEEKEDLEQVLTAAKNNPESADMEAVEVQRNIVKELLSEGFYGVAEEAAELGIAALLVSRGMPPKTALFGASAAMELITSDRVKAGGQGAIDAVRAKIAELRGSGDPELAQLASSAESAMESAEPPAAAGGAGAAGGGEGGDGGGRPPEGPPPVEPPGAPENGDGEEEKEKKTQNKNKENRERRDELNHRIKENAKEFESIFDTSLSNFEREARRKITQQILNKHAAKPVSPEQMEREIDDELRRKTSEFRSKLLQLFNNAYDSNRLLKLGDDATIAESKTSIENLLKNGFIDSATADQLNSLIEDVIRAQAEGVQIDIVLTNEENAISSELRRAILSGQVEFPESQLNLLFALDSPQKLAEYVNSNDKYIQKGKDWYKLFYQDVAEVFDTILSIASSQPNESFMQNFSMMYEGQLHKFLVGRLKTNLSRALAQQKDKEYLILDTQLTGGKKTSLATFEVTETQIASLPKPSDSPYGDQVRGDELRSYEFEHKIPFFKGVEILGDKMAKNLERTQVLHDTEFAERLGAGFEELAKSAERLKTEDLDDMLHGNPALAYALRAYLQSMDDFLALHGHIITSDFGEIDRDLGLDNVQAMAFHTIYGNIHRNEGESPELYERRVKGLVRQAGGLAKVTLAYHAKLQPRRLLISRSIDYLRDAVGKITGIKSVRKKNSYVSGRITALETNLSDFDIRKMMDRWHIPNSAPWILSAFSPRDKEKYDPLTDHYRHRDIMRHAVQSDEAFFIGRTSWLARFDRSQRTMGELTQIQTLDRYLRDGWREEQYDTAFVRENGIIKASKTMESLRRSGTVFVTKFLDDYLRIEHEEDARKPDTLVGGKDNPFLHLKRSEIAERYADSNDPQAKEFDQVWQAVKAFQEKPNDKGRIKNLKRLLYEKEVFDRLFSARPTRALAFEFPRFTPRQEFQDGSMVYQQTLRYIESRFPNVDPQYVKGRLLPFFVSSLSSVENAEWDQRRRKGESLMYRMDSSMIGARAGSEAEPGPLRQLHSLYLKSLGTPQGLTTGFDPEKYKFDRFLEDLTGFSDAIEHAVFDTERYRGLNSDRDERITFSRRYTELVIDEEKEEIITLLKSGNDIAYEEYIQQSPGSRIHQRTLGEAKGMQTEVSPALKQLLLTDMFDFMAAGLESEEEIDEAAKKINEVVMKHLHMTESLHGEPAAYKDALDWSIMIWDRLLGKDRIYRGSLGAITGEINRVWRGKKESLGQTIYPKTPESTPTALDTSQIYHGVKSLLNAAKVPWKQYTVVGYEDAEGLERSVERISRSAKKAESIFGKIPAIGKRINSKLQFEQIADDPQAFVQSMGSGKKGRLATWVTNALLTGVEIPHKNESYGNLAKNVIGATGREYRFENWPTFIAAGVLIFIALAIAAREKEKESK